MRLEIALNSPTIIELLYDEPIMGESRHGSYYLYAVLVNGKEYCFFPPNYVHEELKFLKTGDKAEITKKIRQEGNRTIYYYCVKLLVNKTSRLDIQEYSQPAYKDNLYQIMLESFKDALKIHHELNFYEDDIDKIAISLFIARSRMQSSSIKMV
jgi:hypothetical protein